MTETVQQPKALPPNVFPPERIDVDEFHLRRPRLEDVDALHQAIKDSFPEIHPWMPWCVEPLDIDAQRDFIERSFVNWATGAAFNYVGFDDTGLIASISLMDRIGPGGLEIGYWVRTDAGGRGVITRAAAKLTEIGLGMPGISRIEIHCDAANARSAAVPRRLGFRLADEVDSEITAPAESGREQHWVTP